MDTYTGEIKEHDILDVSKDNNAKENSYDKLEELKRIRIQSTG